MAAKDFFHDLVKKALVKDGWNITHDPFYIKYKTERYEVDLGAEKMLAAQKKDEKIAVEVKSFLGESTLYEYHAALGQFMNYRSGLDYLDKNRKLYLAIPEFAFNKLGNLELFKISFKANPISIMVFDTENEQIIKWIN